MDDNTVFLSGPLRAEKRLPWTVSRCNRLLRPLTSKLAALEKAKAQTSKTVAGRSYADAEPSSSQDAASDSTKGSQRSVFSRGAKVKKTYGGRNTRRRGHSTSASSQENAAPKLAPPTPFLCTTRDKIELERSGELEQAMQHASTHTRCADGKHRIADGAIDAFRNILNATRESEPPKTEQRTSLFTMCLRRLPGHVELEQAYRHQQDPDDKSDARHEVWSELQEYGSVAKRGWPPLRDILCAHSIHLLQRAIELRHLGQFDVAVLVDMLTSSNYQSMEADLVGAWLKAFEFRDTSSVYQCCHQNGIIGRYAFNVLGTDWSEALAGKKCEILDDFVLRKIIPLESLDSNAVELIWQPALRCLSWDDMMCQSTGAQLVEHILLCTAGIDPLAAGHLSGRTQKARKQHYRFIDASIGEHVRRAGDDSGVYNTYGQLCITMLTALMLAKFGDFFHLGESVEPALRKVIRGAAVGVMRACTSPDWICASRRTGQAIPAAVILLTDIAVLVCRKGSSGHEEYKALAEQRLLFMSCLLAEGRTSSSAPRSGEELDDLSWLLVETAANVQHRVPEAGFDMIKTICEFLGASANDLGELLALQVAMTFASEKSGPAHDQYVRDIESRVSKKRLSSDQRVSNSALKWDEGFCEWVNATPLVEARTSPRRVKPLKVQARCQTPPADGDTLKDLEDSETPCGRPKRTASQASLGTPGNGGEDEEDELNAPQSEHRALGDITNVRWCGRKRLRSKR